MPEQAIDHELAAGLRRSLSVENEIQRALDCADRNETQYAVRILVSLCRELYRVNESLIKSRQSRQYWVARTVALVDHTAGRYPDDKGTWYMLRTLIQDINKM